MSSSRRYAVIGAVGFPLILGALTLIFPACPRDSWMFSALGRVIFWPHWIVLWLVQETMNACGIQGQEALQFNNRAMFFVMFACWAAFGYGAGFLIGMIRGTWRESTRA